MELFKTDRRLVSRIGAVPGMESSEVEELFRRRPPLDGMPVLLDDQMRPVEPVSSWFRSLALAERDEATMRAYAYAVLRLMEFLRNRGSDLLTATETDLLEFRHWRTQAQDDPIQRVTWEKEAAAINGLYGWLVDRGQLQRRPWRLSGRRDTLRNGVSRDVKVRHLTLEQYLYFRDVGLGGQTPQATLDMSFRGWSPHRNRAGAELALLTGMRLLEWSTVLLPELGIDTTRPGEPVEFRLAACAKFGRPRMVHIPADALSMISTYLMLERRETVDKAQKTLKGRRDELFVVDHIAQERGRLHGVLDGRRVTRSIAEMPPGLRRNTMLDTGEGLEPLAVFLGRGGRMLLSSSWDKIRWGAWTRMRDHAAHCDAPMLPGTRWLFHDLRHTFALRLLIYLTREAMADGASGELPMSTLLDHMTYNPLLIVQRRLGHASPASTYRYVKYLKDPMREVDEAFRGWTAAGGASYAEIARTLLSLDGDDGATQG
jgi:integrase